MSLGLHNHRVNIENMKNIKYNTSDKFMESNRKPELVYESRFKNEE